MEIFIGTVLMIFVVIIFFIIVGIKISNEIKGDKKIVCWHCGKEYDLVNTGENSCDICNCPICPYCGACNMHCSESKKYNYYSGSGLFDGFNSYGYNRFGFDKLGYNAAGFDKYGYDRAGFDKNSWHKNGTKFDENGYDKNGYNRDGYDKNGYNRSGYDKNGYNKNGYDRYGYDRQGFDKDGYNRNGFDKDGYNRMGYDANGHKKYEKRYQENNRYNTNNYSQRNPYYSIFSNATNIDELKKLYRSQAKCVHPDVSNLPPELSRKLMSELNEAYHYYLNKFTY